MTSIKPFYSILGNAGLRLNNPCSSEMRELIQWKNCIININFDKDIHYKLFRVENSKKFSVHTHI